MITLVSTNLSVIRLNPLEFITPASDNVLAVSTEVAPHAFNFLMIIFLLISGIGGKNAIMLKEMKMIVIKEPDAKTQSR